MKESTFFFRAPDIDNLEMLRATYIHHVFTRHTHAGYVVGMIERGVEAFHCQGRIHHARPGDVVIINPDMAHTGYAGHDQGWSYRMLYPAVSTLSHVACQLSDRAVKMPFFKDAVVRDSNLALQIRRLHKVLEHSGSLLERESMFYDVMGNLIMKHASDPPAIKKSGFEHEAVRQAVTFMADHLNENISLKTLSNHVGLSPFYLTRVFCRHTGLPPVAYRKQRRIRLAQKLLANGMPIAQVAVETGFSDQSHLSRHFKQVVGVTPGQFARSMAYR